MYRQEFLLRVKQAGKPEIYVGRRYGEFVKMHKKLRMELPGKVLPGLPRKNKSHSLYNKDDDDADSLSSVSTQDTNFHDPAPNGDAPASSGGIRAYLPSFAGGTAAHRRNPSKTSPAPSPRASMDTRASLDASSTTHLRSPSLGMDRSKQHHVLYREDQRVSLRASLRNFLQNEQIAQSQAMAEFLTGNPVQLNEEEMDDVQRRMEMDEKRVEEQRQFYEIARARARELDVHMEKFRRDMVENSMHDTPVMSARLSLTQSQMDSQSCLARSNKKS